MSRSSKRTRSQIFKNLKAVMNSYWKVKSTWEQLLIIPSETHHNSFKTTKVNEVKARDTWRHWKLFSHKSNLKKKYPWCHGQNIHALNPEKYWCCLDAHSSKYKNHLISDFHLHSWHSIIAAKGRVFFTKKIYLFSLMLLLLLLVNKSQNKSWWAYSSPLWVPH